MKPNSVNILNSAICNQIGNNLKDVLIKAAKTVNTDGKINSIQSHFKNRIAKQCQDLDSDILVDIFEVEGAFLRSSLQKAKGNSKFKQLLFRCNDLLIRVIELLPYQPPNEETESE